MISIIVPVYNVEQYLKQCIDSILKQTYSDFELILVDDGSTDKSGIICDSYIQVDDRIFVIHKENGGQNSAIKAGLKAARGEYIFFVDSDDWIEENALNILYNNITKNDADLSVSNAYRNCDIQGDFLLHFCEEGNYNRKRIEEEIFPNLLIPMSQKMYSIAPSRCGKLFRKNILVKVVDFCDESIRMGEDRLLTCSYIMLCNKIAIVKEKTYHYRYNPNSISNSYRSDRMEEQRRLIYLLDKIAVELCVYDFKEQLEALTLEAVNMTIFELSQQIYKKDKRELFKDFKAAIKCNIVSKKAHPFARSLFEHIKFHLIINRRVRILWLYSRITAFIRCKVLKKL